MCVYMSVLHTDLVVVPLRDVLSNQCWQIFFFSDSVVIAGFVVMQRMACGVICGLHHGVAYVYFLSDCVLRLFRENLWSHYSAVEHFIHTSLSLVLGPCVAK